MRPDGLTRYWLEIDREAATGQLRDTAQTLLLWKAMLSATAGRIIAGMEAVHIGPIPIKNVAGIDVSVVGGRGSRYIAHASRRATSGYSVIDAVTSCRVLGEASGSSARAQTRARTIGQTSPTRLPDGL